MKMFNLTLAAKAGKQSIKAPSGRIAGPPYVSGSSVILPILVDPDTAAAACIYELVPWLPGKAAPAGGCLGTVLLKGVVFGIFGSCYA